MDAERTRSSPSHPSRRFIVAMLGVFVLAMFAPCAVWGADGDEREHDERESDEREDDEPESNEEERGAPLEILLPVLATDPALEGRIEDALRSPTPEPETIRELLAEAGASGRFVPKEERSLFTSLVSALHDRIRALPPETLALFASLEDAGGDRDENRDDARTRFASRQSPRDPAEEASAAARAFRLAPWSASVHARLLEAGETALRRGFTGLAERSFGDVLSHTARPDHRAAATAGLWLAIAQGDPRESRARLARVLQAVDSDTRLPWFGGEATAAEIARMLDSALVSRGSLRPPANADRTNSAFAIWSVESLPPIPSWAPLGFRERRRDSTALLPSLTGEWSAFDTQAGPRLVQSGPRLVAVYTTKGERLWFRHRETLEEDPANRDDDLSIVPGSFRPCVSGPNLILRWSTASDAGIRSLAAFDLETGEIVWSSAARGAWADIVPVSDAVPGEGSIWLLAAEAARIGIAPVVQTFLVAIDPADFSIGFREMLVTGPRSIRPRHEGGREVADVVQFADPPVISRGLIFSSPSTGAVVASDARDGAVLWARTYERAGEAPRREELSERRGGQPLFFGLESGDTVVFAPRDHRGIFAVHATDGRLRWERRIDAPFRLAGAAGGVLIIERREEILGVDPASGETLWTRRSGRLLAKANRRGSDDGDREREESRARDETELFTGGALLIVKRRDGSCATIDPRRGVEVSEHSDGSENVDRSIAAAVAIDGGVSLIATHARGSAGPESAASPPPISGTTLTLPHRASRLIGPPVASSAHLGSDILAVSEGILERVGASGVRWHRFLPPTTDHISFVSENAVLLAGRGRLAAVDVDTGAELWSRAPSIDLDFIASRSGRVFIAEEVPHRGEVLDGRTGRVLWRGAVPAGAEAVFVDERGFGIVERFEREGREGENGVVLHTHGFERDTSWSSREWPLGRRSGIRKIVAANSSVLILTHEDELFELPFHGGNATEYSAVSRARRDRRRRPEDVTVDGPWRLVRVSRGEGENEGASLILREGDPVWSIEANEKAVLAQGQLFEIDRDRIRRTTLASGERLDVVLEPRPYWGDFRGILAAEADRELLWVFSSHRIDGIDDAHALRVDIFDLAKGTCLVTRQLPGIDPALRARGDDEDDDDDEEMGRDTGQRPPAFAVRGNSAWVTGPFSIARIHFDRDDSAGESGLPWDGGVREPVLVYREPDRTVDASREEIPMEGTVGAMLSLTHDGENLSIRLRTKAEGLAPVQGREKAFAGDRVEVAIARADGAFRFAAGVDRQGDPIIFPSGAGDARERDDDERHDPANWVPAGTAVHLEHNRRTNELIWKISVPLASIEWRIGERAGLTVALFRDEPALGGSILRALWGDGLRGSIALPGGHSVLHLHPLTRTDAVHELARAAEIAGVSSALEEAIRAAEIRAGSPERFLAVMRGFIDERAADLGASELATLDIEVRRRFSVDRHDAVAAIAEQAGASRLAIDRYHRFASAELVQEIRIDERKDYPRSIAIGLEDASGAVHFAYVNKDADWDESSYRIGGPTARDEWVEVRIPLLMLGMHDRPIHALVYGQQGNRAVYWGRTTLEAAGSRRVIVDGESARAIVEGEASWIDDPWRSGRRAHRGRAPSGRYDVVRHTIRLETPAVAHRADS